MNKVQEVTLALLTVLVVFYGVQPLLDLAPSAMASHHCAHPQEGRCLGSDGGILSVDFL